jgi:hypothetical protein
VATIPASESKWSFHPTSKRMQTEWLSLKRQT